MPWVHAQPLEPGLIYPRQIVLMMMFYFGVPRGVLRVKRDGKTHRSTHQSQEYALLWYFSLHVIFESVKGKRSSKNRGESDQDSRIQEQVTEHLLRARPSSVLSPSHVSLHSQEKALVLTEHQCGSWSVGAQGGGHSLQTSVIFTQYERRQVRSNLQRNTGHLLKDLILREKIQNTPE